MNFDLQQLLVHSLEFGVRLVKMKVRVFTQLLTLIARTIADGKVRQLA